MEKQSVKEFLAKKFPPNVACLENAYENAGLWSECSFEEAQKISDQIIELFKEKDMTYTDAYAMLGFIRMDLDYRSERMKL
ncbi:hypothetical protein SLU01_19020 [Sporosarcina luteola]|uniref:Uncharacterized protein n=1 Tax=Sporosarcina luteola TaxID=582850 RepID=A0A511Z823_9BACL|nr:hypothetical protein [Sporosarcina luteola]GEN83590.1 hypothetical protein SLU01_19020 [Sporosarcina luteola]